jgi:hypothetical protein
VYFLINDDIRGISCSLSYLLIRRFVKLIVMEYFCRASQQTQEEKEKRGEIYNVSSVIFHCDEGVMDKRTF